MFAWFRKQREAEHCATEPADAESATFRLQGCDNAVTIIADDEVGSTVSLVLWMRPMISRVSIGVQLFHAETQSAGRGRWGSSSKATRWGSRRWTSKTRREREAVVEAGQRRHGLVRAKQPLRPFLGRDCPI